MANLTVGSLNKIAQSGNIDQMFGTSGVGAEFRVNKELGTDGLQPAGLKDSGKSFSSILKDSVEKVNEMQVQADTSIKELVAGRTKNIHETMLTIERADTSLKLMMQVRNKILDAYKEIMRMPV
jgi:flagellar hook-basal body complex protein FliE